MGTQSDVAPMTANVRDPARHSRSETTPVLAMVVASAIDEYDFEDLGGKVKAGEP